MKKIINKYLGENLNKILFLIYKIYFDKPIINFFNTKYKKNVLISYIKNPFLKGIDYKHTNTAESLEIAKVFNELGYNVDISNYDYLGKIDYKKYEIIFGFGQPLINSFYQNEKKIITIYYGTGMQICHQNHSTLNRIQEVYNKTNIWMPESGRIVQDAWSIQTTLVNAIISLGNETVINSYQEFYSKKIYNTHVTYYQRFDTNEIINNKDFHKAKSNFFWFGSGGLIHKGLDVLLEIFSELPELTLHIGGPIEKEKIFEKTYYKYLYETPNIKTYGFLDLNGYTFKNIIENCGFIVFPSCSEGEATSVVNCMIYGLLPIITPTTGIQTQSFGYIIDEINKKNIKEQIIKASTTNTDEIKEKSLICYNYTKDTFSYESFKLNMKTALEDIIKNNEL